MRGEHNTQDCDFHCLLDKSSTELEEAKDSCQPIFSIPWIHSILSRMRIFNP